MTFQPSEDVKRVLLVEDEPHILELLRLSLSEAGYIVKTADSALAAMNIISQFQPHLVITDNDMPEMSGLEMLQELRTEENYVTVIFVSGNSQLDVILGALNSGADDYIRKPFRIEELLARVANSLRNNDLHRDLLSANQRLLELVDRDYLTGLYNMRSMFDKIEYELKRCRRFKRTVACIMMDMDHFKTVNDGNDHLFGSFVLKEVGRLIKENIREIDFAARYGGDEFLIILTETEEEGAMAFSERLRKAIEAYHFQDRGSSIELTVSIGVAISDGNGVDPEHFLLKADKALYLSKEQGRNRVTVYKGESLADRGKFHKTDEVDEALEAELVEQELGHEDSN
ncbi:MAG: diguanylate cyclase [Bdellovibrionales bacterium]|nr:diguanylate cyclase [Bdellovibrionales bacterium]